MGAGFGGSVIAAVDAGAAGEVANRLGRAHPCHHVEVVDGAIP
jgi:galactokinase